MRYFQGVWKWQKSQKMVQQKWPMVGLRLYWRSGLAREADSRSQACDARVFRFLAHSALQYLATLGLSWDTTNKQQTSFWNSLIHRSSKFLQILWFLGPIPDFEGDLGKAAQFFTLSCVKSKAWKYLPLPKLADYSGSNFEMKVL